MLRKIINRSIFGTDEMEEHLALTDSRIKAAFYGSENQTSMIVT